MEPNHLSILGIIHTAISILALFAAVYALYREGNINPGSSAGKSYIWLTAITCITGFPIMKTGHPTPAHYVGVIVLVLIALGIYSKRLFGKASPYVRIVALSTTIFLSMIPTIVESLTRLPISHPIAPDPNAPIIQNCLLTIFVLYLAGVVYQLVKLKKKSKAAQKTVNFG
jgi:hypothetical protein